MFGAPSFPRNRFTQSLRGKLVKLEQEIVEAHVQVVQSLLDTSPIDPVCLEHTPLLPITREHSAQNSSFERLLVEKLPLTQSYPWSFADLSRGCVTSNSNSPLESRPAFGKQTEEMQLMQMCAEMCAEEQRLMHRTQVAAQSHQKRLSFDAVQPINAKVQQEQDEEPGWPETLPGSKAPAKPQEGTSLTKKLSFESTLKAQGSRTCGQSEQSEEPMASEQITLSIVDDDQEGEQETDGRGNLTLRPQWQDSIAEDHHEKKTKKHRKSRYAAMVNAIVVEGELHRRVSNSKKSSRNSWRNSWPQDESLDASPFHSDRASVPIPEVRNRKFKDRCIISPFSKSWLMWELCGSAMLVHDLVLVPMQVFEMPDNAVLEAMSLTTTLYWTITFVLNFFVSFQRQASLVTSNREIMIHYLKRWFFFDFLLVTSDWVAYAIQIVINTSADSLQNARMARMARLGRLVRILRLLRLMRVGEMMQRIERFIDSEYLSICFLLACNLGGIFFLSHLTACTWFLVGDNQSGRSWLHVYAFKNVAVGTQYMQSLGWSLSTLLGAQITLIYPETMGEFACALVILLVGTIAVSLVFSSTTAAMTRLQQLRADDRDATFLLRKYLRQNNISTALEARVLRYLDIAKTVHAKRIAADKVTLLNILSGPLRLSLQLELHAPHLTSHPFFKMYYTTNAGAMGELCLSAVGFIYLSRSDELFQTFANASHTYFIVSGVMVYRRAKGAKTPRRTIKVEKDTNFSEAALWTCWIHRGSMSSLIESQVLALDVMAFCEITEAHHEVFLLACEYAEGWIRKAKASQQEGKHIWDLSSEQMYNVTRDFLLPRTTSLLAPGFMSVLKEAEDMAAELMDAQSDSDSDDERMFQAALKRTASRSTIAFGRQQSRLQSTHSHGKATDNRHKSTHSHGQSRIVSIIGGHSRS